MGGRSHRVALVEGRGTIYTHRLTRVSQAAFEDACAVVAGHIPLASHHVVYMLTKSGCVGAILASTEAEFRIRHEVRPLMKLLEFAECAGENESTDRVAVAVCSVGVEFSSSISLRNVDLRKVANTGDLYIVRSLNEVRALDSTVRNETSTITILYIMINSMVII